MTEDMNRRELLKTVGLGALGSVPGAGLAAGQAKGAAEAAGALEPSKLASEMTTGNLRSAYGGESMAHMRYEIWGAKARKDGFPNVARLFAAVSYSEEVHAANHFTEMRNKGGAFLVDSMAGFGLGTTSENLQGAIEGETFEVTEMYPTYLAIAKMQSEQGAQRSFRYALASEKIHATMFQTAKQAVDGGKDMALGPVQVCGVCGYTAGGRAPRRCPVCGRSRDKFRTFA